jgi:hypothetical protein
MAPNRKLTGVLQGRTVTRVDQVPSASAGSGGPPTVTSVQFDDGSVMTVQGVADGDQGAAPLGRVRGVRQQGTTLDLDFDDGSTLTLRTAEPTSSVLVRAQDRSLEYAD